MTTAAVSIPFIAGQWSLRGNNNHDCGDPREVSIPFIAGQWSLRIYFLEVRGVAYAGLNPLHCGAVVASQGRGHTSPASDEGLNPLHCGAVVASRLPQAGGVSESKVSIPFIAGQWSLRDGTPPSPEGGRASLNPLHCGAVVASRARRGGRRRFLLRLNPLHCGAVVASLLPVNRVHRQNTASQSPSLRGSGRFTGGLRVDRVEELRLNPLHCGAVVASGKRNGHSGRRNGQSQSPSLRGSGRFRVGLHAMVQALLASQSPSLRGSGRFESLVQRLRNAVSKSQSPSLRGSGRFRRPAPIGAGQRRVSIPFIAGQWSLLTASSARSRSC